MAKRQNNRYYPTLFLLTLTAVLLIMVFISLTNPNRYHNLKVTFPIPKPAPAEPATNDDKAPTADKTPAVEKCAPNPTVTKRWLKDGKYVDDLFEVQLPKRWFVEETMRFQNTIPWIKRFTFSNYLSVDDQSGQPDDRLAINLTIYEKNSASPEQTKEPWEFYKRIADINRTYAMASGDIIEYYEVTQASDKPEDRLPIIPPFARAFLESDTHLYEFGIEVPHEAKIQRQEINVLQEALKSFVLID